MVSSAAMMAMNSAIIAANASRVAGGFSTESMLCPPVIAGCVTLVCVCLMVAAVAVLWDMLKISRSIGEFLTFLSLMIAVVIMLVLAIAGVWGMI